MAQNVFFAVKRDCSCGPVVFHGVDKNYRVHADEIIDEVERRGANVENLHVGIELVARLESANYVRSDPVVAQQDVSDSDDGNVGNSLHRTFTLAICLPDGSNV